MTTTSPLVIDVFSDVVCPWCYIGTERLRQVVDAADARERVQVNFHPFFLDPTTPDEGRNLATALKEKFGKDPAPMYDVVANAGRDVGITFKFDDSQRGYPSVRAHTLLAFARDESAGDTASTASFDAPGPLNLVDAVKRAIFAAYFEEHANINSVDVLADIATKHGLDGDRFRNVVATEHAKREIFSHAEEARRLGIQGVPFFVFGGKAYVSGAQPADVFRNALTKALDANRATAHA